MFLIISFNQIPGVGSHLAQLAFEHSHIFMDDAQSISTPSVG